jgi:putative membrane protein
MRLEKKGTPMIRLMTCGFCLSLAMPVLAQSVGEKTGVNSVIGITPSAQDFVTEAAQSNMFEIQSSKLALGSADSATKDFAQKMIDDHTRTTAELKAAVGNGKARVTLPADMSTTQQSMLTKLHDLQGTNFDKQYHSDQVSGHKDAVLLFQRYSKDGGDVQLKDWAGRTLPALQQHMEMAQNLNK